MLDEPGLSLLYMTFFAYNIEQVSLCRLLLFNLLGQAFEIGLLLLELFNLFFEVDKGAPSITAFVKLPVRVIFVETRGSDFIVSDQHAWVALHEIVD